MTTKELLEKLPPRVVYMLDYFREAYHDSDFNTKDSVMPQIAAYVMGLRDGGLITELQRRMLFMYATL